MPPHITLTAAATTTAPALALRPWRAADVAALVEIHRDPGLRRWATSRVDSEEDGLRWVRDQERGWAAGERLGFAVLKAAPGAPQERLVGSVVVKELSPGKASAEVGYWTAASARGQGVAPRALEVVTAWSLDVFRAQGLERLELLHQVDNSASCRVAEKAGYGFHGILPAAPPAFPLDGHLHVRRSAA
ncbi:GNAT family N-acetyltransferase [Streptomyces sp. AP-93]|uniref:GNAT family N-acetyltransferase n=1 Tax=Streptomyces sp. AP-93 TaxID=2929048 RepID=UPI001FAFE877|nr:GNAT family N-acetyltransferase [Streptomyces sp. AP-93]MCJ0869927.1 GNAT family N-acetyltransferase [Streptomyces sp. AP-93]